MTGAARTVLLAVAAAVLACAFAACGPVHQGPGSSATSGPARPPAPSGTVRPSPSKTGAKAGTELADLSWTSTDDGWALAGVPCGQNTCAEVARTTNGGRTWHWVHAPSAYLALSSHSDPNLPVVSNIRFATNKIGYLFNESMFMTTDGGRTWVRQPQETESLEPASGAVLRLVYTSEDCNPSCAYQIQRAPAGSTQWQTVFTIHPVAQVTVTSQIVWQGDEIAYAVVYGKPPSGGEGSEQATIARSTDGGLTWTTLKDPCGVVGDGGDGGELAAAPGGFAAMTCVNTAAKSMSKLEFMVTSSDSGLTWSGPRWQSGTDAPGWITIPASGEIVGETSKGLVVSFDGGQHWRVVESGANSGGTSDSTDSDYNPFLGFETPSTGRWTEYPRTIWTTRDGGLHWTHSQFPSTGP